MVKCNIGYRINNRILTSMQREIENLSIKSLGMSQTYEKAVTFQGKILNCMPNQKPTCARSHFYAIK